MDFKLSQELNEAIEKAASEVLKRHGIPYAALNSWWQIQGMESFGTITIVSGTHEVPKPASGGGPVIIGAGGAGDNTFSGVARGCGGNKRTIFGSGGGKNFSEND